MGVRYLNHAARLTCAHGGTVQLVPPLRRSTHVQRSPILTEQDLLKAVIVGCPQIGIGLKPCTKIVTVVTGRSIRIKVDGETPILQSLKAITDGVAPGLVTASTIGQSNAETEGGPAVDQSLELPELTWWQRLLQSPFVQGALGLIFGVVQGFAPGGFLMPSPAPHVRAFEFFRGVGEFLAGVTEMAGGVFGGLVGGGLSVTGGGAAIGVPVIVVSAAAVANGYAATSAGLSAMSNALSMSDAGTPASAPETTPSKSTHEGKFADEAKLQDHHQRHGADFGAQNAAEYEKQASDFLTGPPKEGTLEKVRPNGDTVRYNPATDEFGVVKNDGTVRTYYKPDPAVHGHATNLDYFDAQ